MIQLNLGQSKSGPLKVLCLGAHSDDIEIGCGGHHPPPYRRVSRMSAFTGSSSVLSAFAKQRRSEPRSCLPAIASSVWLLKDFARWLHAL